MTKLWTYELFIFGLAQNRKGSSVKKHRLPMMVCIVGLFCVAAAIASPAQSGGVSFKTLYSFQGWDGANPGYVSPVWDSGGNLYGTTISGGAANHGTVFKVTLGGTLTTLHSFCSVPNCADGALPEAGLVRGRDGSFYGTTFDGGINNCSSGCGTIFKMTPGGTLTTLYSFCSRVNCTDGYWPYAAMVQASDGNFYGTTNLGGGTNNCPYGCGTVFKITPSGALTTLYRFCAQANCTDGANPVGGLVQASDGNFYGTTTNGGNCIYLCGTVFKITPAGTLTTLYSFCSQTNCPDGASPVAGLMQASDGNFYGTTLGGGNSGLGCTDLCGTLFKITPQGVLSTLYSFCVQSGCPDGRMPAAGLVQGNDGDFYGTTSYGGSNCDYGCGTVFKITPQGALTTLHSFDVGDGDNVLGGLMQAPDGNFYGTAESGGADGSFGTVYRIGAVRSCLTCRP